MIRNGNSPENIDQYIKTFPKNIQLILKRIKLTIKSAAPKAEEAIRYQIPTFRMNENLVHFAAFKNHISFFPTPSGIKAFKKELSKYKLSKGTVQFSLDQPIPYALIKIIVRYRVKESIEKVKHKV